MSTVRILDADGKKPEFAQWDLDRVLVVSGCSTRPNVRFESGWFPPAIEIESVAAGENFQVIVPNFLLQNPGPLKISVIDQGTEFKALKTIVAQVSPGKKPLDYWDTQEIEEIMRDGQPGQVMTKVGTEKYAIRWGFPAVINMTQTIVDGHPVYSITYKETGTGEDIVTYGMVYPASQLYRKDETYSRSEAYSKSEVDTALDGAVISRNNITAGSGDFRDSLSKPGMYFKFSGEVTGGVNSHSARILLFRSPNDEYGKFLVWVDGVTGSVYTCVYRGPATGAWSDWVQIPSMGEVTGALGAKLDQNQGSGNAGKVMKVGSDGMLAPAAPAVRSFSKSSVGGHEVFSVGYGVSGPMGEMETTGSILPATETYRKDEVDAALATKYAKPPSGIPASDLAEAVHNVIRNAVGSKPTYTITIDTENGNAVTGPNYKWIVVSSLGGEPEVGAEFRIETVADGEITWSSTESVKYQISGGNSVVIIGWRDRSELEGNPAGISGITRRYYAVSATISGNSVVYSYLGSFSSDLALMDDVAVRSFSKTSVDGHFVFNVGYIESGPLGDMETTGTIYPATETYRKDEVDTALAAKYSKPSGGIPKSDLASGVVPQLFEITCTPTALDYSGTMNKTPQEIAAAYARGDRIVATITNVATAELAIANAGGSFVFWAFANTTLVVMTTSINLSKYSTQLFDLAVDSGLANPGRPADAQATGVAIAGKLDANMGAANAGKFLVVGSDGVVAPVTMSAWQGGSF